MLGRAKDFDLEIHSTLDHYKLSAYACVALLVELWESHQYVVLRGIPLSAIKMPPRQGPPGKDKIPLYIVLRISLSPVDSQFAAKDTFICNCKNFPIIYNVKILTMQVQSENDYMLSWNVLRLLLYLVCVF